MAASQINVGLVVAATAPLSVSQDEIYFGQVANTAMKMDGAIAGDSATGRKKFTARQIWRKIEKYCDATEVRTIVVTTIKEQQVDVEIQSSWVCFGDDVAEDI